MGRHARHTEPDMGGNHYDATPAYNPGHNSYEQSSPAPAATPTPTPTSTSTPTPPTPPTSPARYHTALGTVIENLKADPEPFMRVFYSTLFALDFSIRDLFPTSMRRQNSRFVRGLVYILESIDNASQDPDSLDELSEFLGELGRDHRKYGVTALHYDTMTEALQQTLSYLLKEDWTSALKDAVTSAFTTASRVMHTAAETDEYPARVGGTVLETMRIGRNVVIVRLQLDQAIDYLPGQYMAVQVPQCPNTWRYLSAAIPANEAGLIEFHVRTIPNGYFSRQVVTSTRPGDRWVFGRPRGQLHNAVAGNKPICMIARNVALSAMRCILLDMVQSRKRNPLVDVYYGTEYPGELFDASTLANLQASNPWLIVHICADKEEDPWWLKDAPALPSNLLLRQGNPLELAIADGSVHDRTVIVGGGMPLVTKAEETLPRCGVDPRDIHHDPL